MVLKDVFGAGRTVLRDEASRRVAAVADKLLQVVDDYVGVVGGGTSAAEFLRHAVVRSEDPAEPVGTRRYVPARSVVSAGDTVWFAVELPGCGESDVEVTVTPSVVTVRGTKHSDVPGGGESVSTRTFGPFEVAFPLGDGVRHEGAEAVLRNGVLTVRLSRTGTAGEEPRRVPVRVEKE